MPEKDPPKSDEKGHHKQDSTDTGTGTSSLLSNALEGLAAAAARKDSKLSPTSPKTEPGMSEGAAPIPSLTHPLSSVASAASAGSPASNPSPTGGPQRPPLLAKRAATIGNPENQKSPTTTRISSNPGDQTNATPRITNPDDPKKGEGTNIPSNDNDEDFTEHKLDGGDEIHPLMNGGSMEERTHTNRSRANSRDFEMRPRFYSYDQGHKRVPSYDLNSAGRMGPMSHISIRNLQDHSPLESEVETLLQNALDDLDPTKAGPSEAQQTILGDIPEDAAPDTFESKGPATKPALPLQAPDPSDTAQELYELTKDLKNLNRQGSQAVGVSMLAMQDDPDTHTDTLVQNAAKLVNRHQTSIALNGGNPELDMGEPPHAATATDRMRNLLKPIVGSRHLHYDAKKTDTESSQSILLGASHMGAKTKVKARYKDFEDWLSFKQVTLWTFMNVALFYVMIPATGVAAILFYLAGNPPCANGVCETTIQTNSTVAILFVSASASWWVLFIFVRQVVTFSLARATMHFTVDYLALRTRMLTRILGPLATLVIVQSRGWCLTLFFWAAYDFALLYGRYPFANHWLYWQDKIDLMNAENPAGDVLRSSQYSSLLIIALVVSFCIAIKRCGVGLALGRKTYLRYGEELARVMKKALLIGQVASLGRDIEVSKVNLTDYGFRVESYDDEGGGIGEESGSKNGNADNTVTSGILEQIDLNALDHSARRVRITELLGEWEEPEEQRKPKKVNIGAIIQFRQSLSCLNSSVPFSAAFGSATTRQECIACAESLYNRLLISTPGASILSFHVIALLAVQSSGNFNEEKVRELIRLFRPDREGNLSLLDFAKSVDSVYKELRLLRANVANSSKLDRAFENIINIFFYGIVAFIVIAALGINPLVLFASLSGFILGFAFMIGSAASKYFEGLLLIFVRRPYDIGDRINISVPNEDTPTSGSPGWIVKDVDLFTTTVMYTSTNEVATYSNGSLAMFRIINAARSPKASLSLTLKFPIDTPYEKLTVFRGALEKFVKARPREWLAFSSFRPTRVEPELGFFEYSLCVQHRESWQNTSALLNSRAELSNFALELSKRMDMRYSHPPMPVELRMKGGTGIVPHPGPDQMGGGASVDGAASAEFAAVARMFEIHDDAFPLAV